MLGQFVRTLSREEIVFVDLLTMVFNEHVELAEIGPHPSFKRKTIHLAVISKRICLHCVKSKTGNSLLNFQKENKNKKTIYKVAWEKN